MKHFKAPQQSLGNLDTEAAARLLAAACDVALVLDSGGIICDLVCGDDALLPDGHEAWIGRNWIDTVHADSRPKVEALLAESETGRQSRWRQVNHPSPGGSDLPMLYSTIRVGSEGRIVAIGRDLRATATLQQSLLQAQQSMERDYARLRHIEGRYRVLFKMSSDAILVVDGVALKILEANPAAIHVLGGGAQIVGQALFSFFDAESVRPVESLLARLQATGRADELRVRLRDDRRDIAMSGSMFRQDNTSLFVIRLAGLHHEEHTAVVNPKAQILKVVEQCSDGFVVTDSSGHVQVANPAFLELAQVSSEEQVRDELLDRWLGRSGVDMSVLLNSLRQNGSIRLFATTLRGEHGSTAEVEISAVSVLNNGQPYFGFAIRDIGRRLQAQVRPNWEASHHRMPRSLEQLTDLVGRVPLKDLVRESTDVLERMCIEAALQLTGDNRASAAELLGVSRQSLYLKLRRYGLGDLDDDGEKTE
ncbi:MAG: transcriptional regulator PpsR [Rhodospirillales bacterium]|nr:transcriptional regulator PpsR [Rhodospirillales bacterium]